MTGLFLKPFSTVFGLFVVPSFFLAMVVDVLSHAGQYQDQEGRARSGIIRPLKDIMYGLIYPAVLGTAVVLSVLRAIKEPLQGRLHDAALYIAIAAICFYMLSFTSQSEKKEDGTCIAYQWPAFLVDLLEVVLMFLCFYFIGMLDDKITDPYLSPAYLFLLVDVIAVQPLWRLAAGVKVNAFWRFRFVAGITLSLGFYAGLCGGPNHPLLHPTVDIILSFAIVVATLIYVFRDPDFWVFELNR